MSKKRRVKNKINNPEVPPLPVTPDVSLVKEEAGESSAVKTKKLRFRGKGKYVVIGLGRFGYAVAQTLLRGGEDVLAIDKDEDRVQEVSDMLPNVVVASGADGRVLRALGVGPADTGIVSCGESIEDSILATAALREIGLEEIICKAITATHADILRRVGATRAIQPEHEMGLRLAESLLNPNVLEHLHLSREHSIIEMMTPLHLVGETLVSSDLRKNFGVNLIAVSREKADGGDARRRQVEIPTTQYKFNADDHLILLGRDEQIEALRLRFERRAR